MQLKLLALENANLALDAKESMEAADDICIESRAAFIAFIDDSTWSHSINPQTKKRLNDLLEHSRSLLELFLRKVSGKDHDYVAEYLKAVNGRILDVNQFKLIDEPPSTGSEESELQKQFSTIG